jgi:hypothetical protein
VRVVLHLFGSVLLFNFSVSSPSFTSTTGKGAIERMQKKSKKKLSLPFFVLFFFAMVCRRVEDVVYSASERVLNENHEKKARACVYYLVRENSDVIKTRE